MVRELCHTGLHHGRHVSDLDTASCVEAFFQRLSGGARNGLRDGFSVRWLVGCPMGIECCSGHGRYHRCIGIDVNVQNQAGRYCPPELIEKADLVTEMQEIKHYYQKGVAARKGIES
jgi:hypothetical protein